MAIDSPSIFGSHTSAGARPRPFCTRSYQATSDASSNTLSRLSSFCECATGVNSVLGFAPTFRVGESAAAISGCAASRATSSRKSAS
jgi:hypothetical protein